MTEHGELALCCMNRAEFLAIQAFHLASLIRKGDPDTIFLLGVANKRLHDAKEETDKATILYDTAVKEAKEITTKRGQAEVIQLNSAKKTMEKEIAKAVSEIADKTIIV